MIVATGSLVLLAAAAGASGSGAVVPGLLGLAGLAWVVRGAHAPGRTRLGLRGARAQTTDVLLGIVGAIALLASPLVQGVLGSDAAAGPVSVALLLVVGAVVTSVDIARHDPKTGLTLLLVAVMLIWLFGLLRTVR